MPDKIIQLNKDLIKHDLKNDLVPKSVEETLNTLIDKEADESVNAEKYERSSAARDVVPAIIIEISKLPHGKSN